MADANPTFAAANESTGMEPLNAQPTSPQPPKQDTSLDTLPSDLTSLPSGFEPVMFPLDLGSRTKSSQTVSSLPTANQFEDLVKVKTRPPGPARAEEVDLEALSKDLGAGVADVVEKIKAAVEGGEIGGYKVNTGVGNADLYLMGLDLDGERLVGVCVKEKP